MAPIGLGIPSQLSCSGIDESKLLSGTQLAEHEEGNAGAAAADQQRALGLTTLSKITVKCGTFVDVITFHYSDGLTSVRGNDGGEDREPFQFLQGEHLAAINGRESDGESLDAVQFETDRGRKSMFYGNLRGGRSFSLRASEGSQIWDIERKSQAHCGGIAKLVEKRGLPRIPSPVLDLGELRTSALDDGRCCELAGYVGPRLVARGGPRVRLLRESGDRVGRLCERLEAASAQVPGPRCAITRGDNAPASNVQLVPRHEDTAEARRKRALTAQLGFMSRCMDSLAPPEGASGGQQSPREGASGAPAASAALPLLGHPGASAAREAPGACGTRHKARQTSQPSPRRTPQSGFTSGRQVRLPRVRGFRPKVSGSVGPLAKEMGAVEFWRRDPRCSDIYLSSIGQAATIQ